MIRQLCLWAMLCMLSLKGAGQEPACNLLWNASDAYCREDYERALQSLLDFRKGYSDHTLIDEVSFRIGHFYCLLRDYESARTEFKAILNSTENKGTIPYQRCDTYYFDKERDCHDLIYTEDYGNLQHYACTELYNICMREQQYEQAMNYLVASDKKYSYRTDCGNDADEQDVMMALRYHDVFLPLGDTAAAMNRLLEVFFTLTYNSGEAWKNLKSILDTKYTVAEKKAELENAVNSITSEERSFGNNPPRTYYSITMFGHSFGLPYLIYSNVIHIPDMNRKMKGLPLDEREHLVRVKSYIRELPYYQNLGN